MRDSIIFYRSFYEAIDELPLEMQAKVYKAIFEYSLNFKELTLEGLPKTIFTLIKPQLDANNKRFENGKKGGRKLDKNNQNRTKTEPKPKQEESKTEANNNVNNNDNVNDILLEKETKEDIFLKENLQPENLEEITIEPLVQPPEKEIIQDKLKIPDDFKPIWKEWKEYRKDRKIKNYAGIKWEQKAVDKLFDLSKGNADTARKIINESITNTWTGFFKLNENEKGNSKTSANNSGKGRRIAKCDPKELAKLLARDAEMGNLL